MPHLNSALTAWSAVAAHANEIGGTQLRSLTAADAQRWQQLHVEHGAWLLDISRQRITSKTLSLLMELARSVELPARIAAMFRGDPINTTEQRAVLHTALRSEFAGSAAIQAEVKDSRQTLSAFAAAVRRGDKRGVTGKRFQHVVNVGIGGGGRGR